MAMALPGAGAHFHPLVVGSFETVLLHSTWNLSLNLAKSPSPHKQKGSVSKGKPLK